MESLTVLNQYLLCAQKDIYTFLASTYFCEIIHRTFYIHFKQFSVSL